MNSIGFTEALFSYSVVSLGFENGVVLIRGLIISYRV